MTISISILAGRMAWTSRVWSTGERLEAVLGASTASGGDIADGGAFHTEMAVRAAEGYAFALPLAGIGSRVGAQLIDWTVRAGLALGIGIFGVVPGFSIPALILGSALLFFYEMLFELLWQGRTPGKAVLGLRVVGPDGGTPDPLSIVIRNSIRLFEGFTFAAVGLIAMASSEKAQRLGDIAANTYVTREPRTNPFIYELNPQERVPAAGIDLTRIDQRYAALAEEYFVRYHRKPTPVLAALAEELATLIRHRSSGFPADLPARQLLETVMAIKRKEREDLDARRFVRPGDEGVSVVG